MCIRDSAHSGLIVFWAGAMMLIEVSHFTFDKPMCCLLYTSDAADDLLCVDLGGRRIIKKKSPYA